MLQLPALNPETNPKVVSKEYEGELHILKSIQNNINLDVLVWDLLIEVDYTILNINIS